MFIHYNSEERGEKELRIISGCLQTFLIANFVKFKTKLVMEIHIILHACVIFNAFNVKRKQNILLKPKHSILFTVVDIKTACN